MKYYIHILIVFGLIISSTPSLANIQLSDKKISVKPVEKTSQDKSIFKDKYSPTSSSSYWTLNNISNGIRAGFGLGVLSGLNVFVGKKFYGDGYWSNAFGLRLDYNNLRAINPDYHYENDSNAFGVRLNSQSIGAVLDYYPLPGIWGAKGWRFSTGLYSGRFSTEVYATQKHGTSMHIGNKYYRINGGNADVQVDLRQNLFGMYIGTGVDINIYNNVKMYIDLGAIFTQAPDIKGVDLSTNNLNIQVLNRQGNWVNYPNALFLLDLVNTVGIENIGKIANAVNDLFQQERSLMPIVKVGLMYKF